MPYTSFLFRFIKNMSNLFSIIREATPEDVTTEILAYLLREFSVCRKMFLTLIDESANLADYDVQTPCWFPSNTHEPHANCIAPTPTISPPDRPSGFQDSSRRYIYSSSTQPHAPPPSTFLHPTCESHSPHPSNVLYGSFLPFRCQFSCFCNSVTYLTVMKSPTLTPTE